MIYARYGRTHSLECGDSHLRIAAYPWCLYLSLQVRGRRREIIPTNRLRSLLRGRNP